MEVGRPLGAKYELWSEQLYPPWLELPDLPGTPCLVYLDVWEGHVSAMQDDSIREVALGGPDTTSRAQVVWQIRAAGATPDLLVECGDFPLWSWRRDLVGTQPLLRAWAERAGEVDEPRLAVEGRGYRGVENHLYRVEITDVGAHGARFVWSRDNGSAVAAWTGREGDKLLVEGLRATVRGFMPGDWLELIWDEVELAGQSGPRTQVVAVDAGTVTFDASTTTSRVPVDPSRLTRPIVRRWDSVPPTVLAQVGGAIDITESDDDGPGITSRMGSRSSWCCLRTVNLQPVTVWVTTGRSQPGSRRATSSGHVMARVSPGPSYPRGSSTTTLRSHWLATAMRSVTCAKCSTRRPRASEETRSHHPGPGRRRGGPEPSRRCPHPVVTWTLLYCGRRSPRATLDIASGP